MSLVTYREVLGSDVPSDGMYLELRNSADEVVACVFRSDATGTFTVHLGPSAAPEQVVDEFVLRAKASLTQRAAC